MNKRLLLFICLLFSLVPYHIFAQAWKTYPYQEAGTLLTFPGDEGHHPNEPIEWWYTNARVTGQNTGTEYSFMLTYFYYPALGFDGFRIFNIANEDTGEFHDETRPCLYPTLAQDHLEIKANVLGRPEEAWQTRKDESGTLVPFEYLIKAGGQHGRIDLAYQALKRPLLVGGTGYLPQGVNNYTYYYSQTEIQVSGTLTFGNVTEPVTGTAWIDRQYGNFNPNENEAYEWFSIQLSNGMDINLWNIFTDDNRIPDTSTYRFLSVYLDEARSLTSSDFQLERLAYAWMPDNKACYAQQWRMTAPSLGADLLITTRHNDHEVALPFRFFEGTTTLTGTINGQAVTGHGFAELLRHYEHPRIKFTHPGEQDTWDISQPIRWTLNNPDDGRQISYDLEVSLDQQQSFTSIAEGLRDTTFLWDPIGFPADSLYWFRLTGYSSDRTLIGTTETSMAFPLTTGLSEVKGEKIRIFPNPAKGMVYLDLGDQAGKNGQLRLISADGKVLRTQSFKNESLPEMDISALPAGVYWLEWRSGEKPVFGKLVVE